jgi:putative aminotransferase
MELGKFNFKNRGQSLAELGVASYAYTYQDMLAYIDWIESKKFIILGGDVYVEGDRGLELTYDGWYYSPKNNDSDSLLSISVAKDYISKYIDSNGGNFYFTVVTSE